MIDTLSHIRNLKPFRLSKNHDDTNVFVDMNANEDE